MNLVRQAGLIARKDLTIEVRGRYGVVAVLPFAVTLLVVFGLSLGPGRTLLQTIAPALLWLAVLFASVLAFRQAYQAEAEDGALDGLVLAPVDRAAVFLGKAGAVAAQLLALEFAVVLLVIVLFGLPIGEEPAAVAAAFVLGTIGLAAVGSLFGAVSESPRAREGVFPLLVLPLATPVLVAGIKATELAAQGRGADAVSWLGLLIAFDLVVVSVGTLVFGYLLED
ncbi:MAG: heme exporter protein CcmB [Actinomycetota bacterium]|nr:heme exporter protein CcmB [Actinomycetota bacterium]